MSDRVNTRSVRTLGRSSIMMLDVLIASASLMAAYLARFEGALSEKYFTQLLILLPVFAGARIIVNWAVGLYRIVWRFIGLREAIQIALAAGLASAILLILRLTLHGIGDGVVVPIGIIFIDACLCTIGMIGVRFLPRIAAELRARRSDDTGVPTLLIGASELGTAVVREAVRNPDMGIRPIGFLDHDPGKRAMKVHGLPILDLPKNLDDVMRRNNIAEVIVTDPTMSSKEMWQLLDTCSKYDARVRTVSEPFKLSAKAKDEANPSTTLRSIRIEDLLNRSPVPSSLSMEDLAGIYGGDRILVTGAGGSIGSELCRQLAQLEPAQILLVERDETNLFEIGRELNKAHGPIVVQLLADITDMERMTAIFEEYKPDSVFHAAAYKHVPMMERFPADAIKNNIIGTKNIATLAHEYDCTRFVLVSTDKAVRPTSVMGATKRLAEMVVRELAKTSTVEFSCVRFGNVLGSRGSVVGIFRDQIANGGPVTVTHRDATRYFMTIPEAANLVIQAGTLGGNGDVFMLDMGTPVRILDLAEQMIKLSGAPEGTIDIDIVGTRPGEKLFEELRAENEKLEATGLRKIMRSRVDIKPLDLAAFSETLRFLMRDTEGGEIRKALRNLDIGYKPGPEAGAGAQDRPAT